MGFDCWRPICPLDLQTICHNERYMTQSSLTQITQELIKYFALVLRLLCRVFLVRVINTLKTIA